MRFDTRRRSGVRALRFGGLKAHTAVAALLAALLSGLTQVHAAPQGAANASPAVAVQPTDPLADASAGARAPASPMAPTTATPSPGVQTPAAETHDPVLRLLSDRGLLPSTQPVNNLAQQVKERASDLAADLVISAMDFLGVPYRRGGDSADEGFDCSGFTRHVFENSVGLLLPRRAVEQAHAPGLVAVQRDELKPGDLVFFNTLRRTFSHVGIYIGDGKFIHSPRAGGKVRVEDMRMAYWQSRYDGARRAPSVGGMVSAAQTGR